MIHPQKIDEQRYSTIKLRLPQVVSLFLRALFLLLADPSEDEINSIHWRVQKLLNERKQAVVSLYIERRAVASIEVRAKRLILCDDDVADYQDIKMS
jgi:hypothetical protein